MSALLKTLAFFRITDAHDNLLSITSIALYISLFKLATTPNAGYSEIGALIATLGAYSAKKLINKNQSNEEAK